MIKALWIFLSYYTINLKNYNIKHNLLYENYSNNIFWVNSYGRFFIVTYCGYEGGHLHLDSKIEILTIFSILDWFYDLKMEILPVFSILNWIFDLKMEILPVFSILNNKKIWETMNHFWFASQIFYFLYIQQY